MKLKVAVITGHHIHDVINFHKLWNSISGIEPYIQHMEDFCSSNDTVRDSYDCIVFYMMVVEEIKDEMPWYWGKPKSALEHLGSKKQGIVILHHTIWAYEKWPYFSELLGMPDRKASGYHADQKINVRIVDTKHSITRGLKDWTLTDETYEITEPGSGNKVLIELEHPQSIKAGAWVRKHKNSRLFCCVLGHDNKSWEDANFRELLRRGVFWSADSESKK